jgi:hypothetical protein
MDTIVNEANHIKTFTSKKANKTGAHHKTAACEVLWDEQNADDIIIPEEHKQIVRERIKRHENNSDSYLSWSDIERQMAAR